MSKATARPVVKTIKVPAECWTRCVGYFRPVSQFNEGKKQEFKDRLPYKIPEDLKRQEYKV